MGWTQPHTPKPGANPSGTWATAPAPTTREGIGAYLDDLGCTLWARSFDLSETHSREAAVDFVTDLLDGLGR